MGYPVVPGVPSAGHVTRGGFWHPGYEDNCMKGNCHTHHFVPKRSGSWAGEPSFIQMCDCGYVMPPGPLFKGSENVW